MDSAAYRMHTTVKNPASSSRLCSAKAAESVALPDVDGIMVGVNKLVQDMENMLYNVAGEVDVHERQPYPSMQRLPAERENLSAASLLWKRSPWQPCFLFFRSGNPKGAASSYAPSLRMVLDEG